MMDLHAFERKTSFFFVTVSGVLILMSTLSIASEAGTKSGADSQTNAATTSSAKTSAAKTSAGKTSAGKTSPGKSSAVKEGPDKSRASKSSRPGSSAVKNSRQKALDLIDQSTSSIASGKFQEGLSMSLRAVELCPDLSDAHCQKAICLYILDRLAEAEVCAKKAVELDPKSAKAWQALAGVSAAQGNLLAARGDLERAVRLNPKSDAAWYSLGRLYTMLDDARGKECFEKALALNPKVSRYEQDLGYMYHGMKQFGEAKKHYRKAIKLDPQNMGPWRLLTLIAVRDPSTFKQLIAEMSKLKPLTGPGWEELARAYMTMGEREMAAKCMTASKKCPQDLSPRGLFETATILLELQEFIEAEKLLKRVEAHAPSAAKIKKCLAIVYVNTNRTAEAVKSLRLASFLEPNNSEFLADLSTLLMDSDLKESETLAYKAVNMRPKSPFLLAHLSYVLSRRGKTKEALKYARMSEQLNPTIAEAYHRIAFTLIYTKDLEGAKEICQKAINCEPGNSVGWFNLGALYFVLDQPKPASDALKHALKLNPLHAGSWELLSCVLAELNDKKGSEEAFKKAIALAPNDQRRHDFTRYRNSKMKEKKSTLPGILLPQLRTTTDAPSSKL